MDDLTSFNNWVQGGVPPHICKIPTNVTINFSKALISVTMVSLMLYYDNWTLRNWLYTSIHSAYGILWLIKDYTFPDSGLQTPASLGSTCILLFGILLPYMLGGYWMIKDTE
jgi:hypothetical protein